LSLFQKQAGDLLALLAVGLLEFLSGSDGLRQQTLPIQTPDATGIQDDSISLVGASG